MAALILLPLPPGTRAIPAIIQVTTTADAEFPMDGGCSLRAAILASNLGGIAGNCGAGTLEQDSIRFALGAGIPTISIASDLPTITQPVTINGATGGSTRIRLLGPGAGIGLRLGGDADASVVRNLTVDGFANGIYSDADDISIRGNVIGPNTNGVVSFGLDVEIGGTVGVTPGSACTGDCNLVRGNGIGLYLNGTGTVVGNLIGTNAAGTMADGNDVGIFVEDGAWDIGGTAAGAGNLISGNDQGVDLRGCFSNGTFTGNRIGTNTAGTAAIPNTGFGLQVFDANACVIGGRDPGEGNVISGNGTHGISLVESAGVVIEGNHIGTSVGGAPLGNGGDGIHASSLDPGVSSSAIGAADDPAAANVIAHNGGAGVRILGTGDPAEVFGNSIRGNSIHSNVDLGIVLQGQANEGVLPPLITGLRPLRGTACAGCEVDVYSDNLEEGRDFEGTATANGSGQWTFDELWAGPILTATTTDAGGNTSAFSAPHVPTTPFTDIGSSIFKKDIEWLNGNGITSGCTPTKYCPTASVTREQMASFLVRMFDLPPATVDYFTDDEGSVHEDDINRLAEAEVTTGCTATTFCPKANVLRGQMASFLARAAGLVDGAGNDYFNDDDASPHEPDIDRNAAAGIATGCAPYAYCPAGTVTREQMAAFLRRIIVPVASPPFPAP